MERGAAVVIRTLITCLGVSTVDEAVLCPPQGRSRKTGGHHIERPHFVRREVAVDPRRFEPMEVFFLRHEG